MEPELIETLGFQDDVAPCVLVRAAERAGAISRTVLWASGNALVVHDPDTEIALHSPSTPPSKKGGIGARPGAPTPPPPGLAPASVPGVATRCGDKDARSHGKFTPQLFYMAAAHITALAAANSEDDRSGRLAAGIHPGHHDVCKAVVAYTIANETAIQVIEYPSGNRICTLTQRDVHDMEVAAVAFAPPTSTIASTAATTTTSPANTSARGITQLPLLLSFNTLPTFTLTVWDTMTRTALCRISALTLAPDAPWPLPTPMQAGVRRPTGTSPPRLVVAPTRHNNEDDEANAVEADSERRPALRFALVYGTAVRVVAVIETFRGLAMRNMVAPVLHREKDFRGVDDVPLRATTAAWICAIAPVAVPADSTDSTSTTASHPARARSATGGHRSTGAAPSAAPPAGATESTSQLKREEWLLVATEHDDSQGKLAAGLIAVPVPRDFAALVDSYDSAPGNLPKFGASLTMPDADMYHSIASIDSAHGQVVVATASGAVHLAALHHGGADAARAGNCAPLHLLLTTRIDLPHNAITSPANSMEVVIHDLVGVCGANNEAAAVWRTGRTMEFAIGPAPMAATSGTTSVIRGRLSEQLIDYDAFVVGLDTWTASRTAAIAIVRPHDVRAEAVVFDIAQPENSFHASSPHGAVNVPTEVSIFRTRVVTRRALQLKSLDDTVRCLRCLEGTDMLLCALNSGIKLYALDSEHQMDPSGEIPLENIEKLEVDYKTHLLLAFNAQGVTVIDLDRFFALATLDVDRLTIVDAKWDPAPQETDAAVAWVMVTTGEGGQMLLRYIVPRPLAGAPLNPLLDTLSPMHLARLPDSKVSAFNCLPIPQLAPPPDTVESTDGRLLCCLTEDHAFRTFALGAISPAATNNGSSGGGGRPQAQVAPGGGLSSVATTISVTPNLLTAGHSKVHPNAQVYLCDGTHILTSAADGVICIRSLTDLERGARIYTHDAQQGNVFIALAEGIVISAGDDCVVRFWRWDPSTSGGKAMPATWANVVKNNLATRAAQSTEAVNAEMLSVAGDLPVRVAELADLVRQFCDSNMVAPLKEQLPLSEVVVNAYHAAALQDAGAQSVAQAKEAIHAENRAHEELARTLLERCWNPMLVQGKTVRALGGQLGIPNYPIRTCDPRHARTSAQLLALRSAQAMVYAHTAALEEVASGSGVSAEKEKEGLDNAMPPVSDLLHTEPTQMYTKERQVIQLHLLELRVQDLQREFNTRFDAILKVKADEIGKINERMDRIKAVSEELSQALQMQAQVFSQQQPGEAEAPVVPVVSMLVAPLELNEEEVPERALTVEDSEVKAPKFMSEEEEVRLEALKRADEERSRNTEDDSRERALQMMMGGTLEKEERRTAVVISRPDFIDSKPKLEWSEEEKKAAKEYEKKVATAREEQEKYRKALETEMRKLEASVEEIKLNFDARIMALLDDKLKTDHSIQMCTLRSLFLARRVVYANRLRLNYERHNHLAKKEEEQRAVMVEVLPEIKATVDNLREAHEVLLRRDKDIERSVRKEFSAAGNMPIDTVWKLFRKREQDGHGVDVIAPLSEEDFIAGFTTAQWALLNDLRIRKLQVEAEIKVSFAKLQHMQRMAEDMVSEAESRKNQCEALGNKMTALESEIQNVHLNVVDLWPLKQGQVEVPQEPVVTDYSSAVLIPRGSVEALNSVIRSLAKQKLDALREMKNYRRGILALDWECKVLDFQADDVALKTRDIQLLRVTKAMQEYIRSGDDAAAAAQVATLERLLEHADSGFAHKRKDRARTLRKLRSQLREKSEQNTSLSLQVSDLSQVVDTRQRIHALHQRVQSSTARAAAHGDPADPIGSGTGGSGTFASGGGSSGSSGVSSKHEVMMNDIAMRRKLVDLARAQAQDIAVLTREVERWRLKTFPAFPPLLPVGGSVTPAAVPPSTSPPPGRPRPAAV